MGCQETVLVAASTPAGILPIDSQRFGRLPVPTVNQYAAAILERYRVFPIRILLHVALPMK